MRKRRLRAAFSFEARPQGGELNGVYTPARMSIPWRVAALLLAIAALFVLAVPATRIGPSLASAHAQLVAGEIPLWDGAPLLANPHLGLAHPITLVAALANSIAPGAVLRVFAMLFFTFALFRGWGVGTGAAIFGAIAFALCTTHILSWSALTVVALPFALAAAQEHARAPRASTFVLLTIALALSFLGGDERIALRVILVTAAYVVFLTRNVRVLVTAAISVALAFGLTAFYWMPLQDVTPHIARSDAAGDPLRFLALLAPNVLGSTGEGYAGILTLILAIVGLIRSERSARWFFALVALIAFWPLGLAALATLGLCAFDARTFRIAAGCVGFAWLTVWFARAEYLPESFAWTQALITVVTIAIFAYAPRRVIAAAVLTFIELALVAQQAKPRIPQLLNDRAARIVADVPHILAGTPPAFAVQRYVVQAEVPDVIPRLKAMRDLRSEAVVHDVPPSIVEQAPQLAHGNASAPRDVRVRAATTRQRELDVAAANGWSLIVTHDVDWPGWRGYWNGHRLPVVTVDGAFAGAFVPPEKGTLELRYWPPPFVDGLRVSVISLLLFAIAIVAIRKAGGRPSPGPLRS
jgi:hypothetical protein